MTANAPSADGKGLTVARAAEVLWTYSSPELYELLVLRRAMPINDYGRFIAEAICAAVLDVSPQPVR